VGATAGRASASVWPPAMILIPCLVPCPASCPAGQVEEGAALHANWAAAWNRFGWLPEMFDAGLEHRHPTETGE
jgi:hypothetical protein